MARPKKLPLAAVTKPGHGVAPLAAEILRRIVAAGLADRFLFVDVVKPFERMKYIHYFENMIEDGYVERVTVGAVTDTNRSRREHVAAGRWYYRLTEAGLQAAKLKG